MRVMLAALHPPGGSRPIGGVQSWCATVKAELQNMGHQVETWGPGALLSGLFDAGILANIRDTRRALLLCRQSLVMCHGIIAAEKPPAHGVAFTSEEVRKYWSVDGPIIRQPIDLDFWRPKKTPRRYLVRFSYRTGLPEVERLAQSMKLHYIQLNRHAPQPVRDVLRQAVCVIATGRAAVEAMACGVPVVICDHREYQGPLLDRDTIGSMHRNYSGRGGVIPDQQQLHATIIEAIDRGSLRAHVEAHHDAREITRQLLCSIC